MKVKFEAYSSGAERTLRSPLCVLRALGRSGQVPSPHVLSSAQAGTPRWVGTKQFIKEHESTSERTASPPLVDMLSTFLKYRSNFPTSSYISLYIQQLWAAGQIQEVACLIKLYRNVTMCSLHIIYGCFHNTRAALISLVHTLYIYLQSDI